MAREIRDRRFAEIGATAAMGETRVTMFTPNAGGQEQVVRSTKHEKIISGGNDSGKTYLGTGILPAYHTLPEKDKYGNPTGYRIKNPYNNLRLRVPRDGILGIISSWSENVQKSNIEPVFEKVLGPYEKDRKMEGGVRKWSEFESGTILFKCQSRGVQGYQGDKIDFADLDEPHKKQIYNEVKMRLPDRDGYMWNTATYVMDDAYSDMQLADVIWMQEFIQDWTKDPKAYPDTDVIFITSESNKNHIRNYNLMVNLTKAMSVEERTARLTGHLIGHLGDCKFDREKLEQLRTELNNSREAHPQYGRLDYDPDENVDNMQVTFRATQTEFPKKPKLKDQFIIKIWEHPVPSNGIQRRPKYFIGCDPAEGRKGGDFTAAYVVRGDTGEEVAALHGFLSEIELSRQLYLLGMYYCDDDQDPAMLAVECNKPTTLTYLINGIPDYDIPAYGISRLYHRPLHDDMVRGLYIIGKDPGWLTTARTRDQVISAVERILVDAFIAMERDDPFIIKDIGLVEECIWFVLNSSGTRYEAKTGVATDDRIFARGIAERCRQQYARTPRQSAAEKENPHDDLYMVDLKDGTITVDWGTVKPDVKKQRRISV